MKKFLFDTSTLVAALVESHPKQPLALPWLQRVKKGIDKGVVSGHSLAELYNGRIPIFRARTTRITF